MGDPEVRARASETYFKSVTRNRLTLGVLKRVLESLADSKGRKSVILVSQGFIYDPNLSEFKDVVQASRRGNAAVYFLDTRGLSGMDPLFGAEFHAPGHGSPGPWHGASRQCGGLRGLGGERGRRPGAQDGVPRPGPAGHEARGVLQRRRPAEGHAGTDSRELVDDQPSGHAGHGLLASRVDLGHTHGIRAGERLGEAVREVERPRVEMRLEERQQPPTVSNSGEVGCELGRVVRVAVDDGDAAGLALRFQPAAGTAELDEHSLGFRSCHAGELERCERRGRVAPVVLTWHPKLELDGLELLGPHDARHAAQPVLEERLDLGPRDERRVVVEVDVEEHGDLRSQGGDGAIRLVPFDDEPAGARPGVAAELRHVAADEERRPEAEPVEAEGDHRAGGRLPVRAGDDDRAPLCG